MKKLLIIIVLWFLASLPVQAQVNGSVNSPADATKPVISSVSISRIAKNTAKISWVTNEISTSYVDFGLNDVYGNTLGDGAYTLSHEVTLLGLIAETPYHFRIRSKDAAGNEAVSTDTTFTTLAATTNTNTSSNSNINSSTNLNTNKKTNINTNTNKNANSNLNANKNTNANTNKNANSNKNSNTNTNKNLNVSLDDSASVNSNLNANTNEDLTNTDDLGLTNLNANSDTESTKTNASDGRTGLILIIGGVVLLIVIIVFAWKKLRGQSSFKP
ncbi:MAG: hypothetical protein COT26_00620 [Candidatus Kerfeldbacteria bacterium CG08_land_8_20_14_0_20_43_14]|uniref:Fibronectin type-III domain-containing protein n=1 Tax=Candidatus Kerfeldbacteria bacterium CG08_land_8_20_14_0_20_43_14 TaxID=2014246 RepID=A0A2H0YR39_9BACT|nr:MAG: hypothetical protein COT26_00620 [Candidatus Kerfeldbacteria bacterium CG08_land_8_20_14_0_20_43_14]